MKYFVNRLVSIILLTTLCISAVLLILSILDYYEYMHPYYSTNYNQERLIPVIILSIVIFISIIFICYLRDNHVANNKKVYIYNFKSFLFKLLFQNIPISILSHIILIIIVTLELSLILSYNISDWLTIFSITEKNILGNDNFIYVNFPRIPNGLLFLSTFFISILISTFTFDKLFTYIKSSSIIYNKSKNISLSILTILIFSLSFVHASIDWINNGIYIFENGKKIYTCNGYYGSHNCKYMVINIQKLIDQGYLKSYPKCKCGGNYVAEIIDDTYYIGCSYHGIIEDRGGL